MLGLVDVGLLRDLGAAEAFPGHAVHDFVPQQGAALALLGFQRGFGDLELVDELGGFRAVIGAAEDVHGGILNGGILTAGTPDSGERPLLGGPHLIRMRVRSQGLREGIQRLFC